MDSYKEFKRTYRKYFLEGSDFEVSDLITSADEIPTEDDCYKNAIIRAYSFLSKGTNRDLGHLKILTSYEKLFKKNHDDGMKASLIDFATTLYILHHFCVRILRSPWRKDAFMIKAYNGFYQYTLRMTLSASVIEEMLLLLGFVYDPVINSFAFNTQSFNGSSIRMITEAGIGFFLSYTHCMGKNDPQFKERVMALTPLLYQPPKDEATKVARNSREILNSTDRPTTSGLVATSSHLRNEHYAHSGIREKRRDNKKNYHGGVEHMSMSQPATVTQSLDLYGPEDEPVDLCMRNGLQYGHTQHRSSHDRCQTFSSNGSAPGSDSMDDQALYEPGDDPKSSSGNFHATLNSEAMLMAKPSNSRQGPLNLDLHMNKCGIQDQPSRIGDFVRSGLQKKHLSTRDDNYVQLYQTVGRGSPDGEMTKEPQSNYFPTTQHSRSVYGKEPKRSSRSFHIYHEISDR